MGQAKAIKSAVKIIFLFFIFALLRRLLDARATDACGCAGLQAGFQYTNVTFTLRETRKYGTQIKAARKERVIAWSGADTATDGITA
ncbi:MAG TPA: hypothetical protein VGG62_08335 [Terracidiphilus sp.]|jgi:hypothetical protein